MSKAFFLILFCLLLVSLPLLSQEEETRDLYTRWEETLRFGIESDVLSAIDNMIEEKIDYFADEISELFSSPRSKVRIKALDFFEAFERNDLISPVLSELEYYQEIDSPEFTSRLIRHLERYEQTIDDALWSLLKEMLQEEGRDVKYAIISYLGTLKHQPSALLLGELYSEADIPLQEVILKTLGQIKDANSQEMILTWRQMKLLEKNNSHCCYQFGGILRESTST